MKHTLHYCIAALLLVIMAASCSPNLYYLGDTYTATDTVQVFYNLQDIKQPYKVIGRITNQPAGFDTETIKNKMILKAQQVGANGIVFDDLHGRGREGNDKEIQAQLIRYTQP
jgi:hypothetical protein